MITASTMQPLPVRPIDGARRAIGAAPLPRAATAGTMHPLPHPTRTATAPVADASSGAALDRMLTRLGLKVPSPIVAPYA